MSDIIHDIGSAEDETNEFYHKWLDRKAEAESLRSELEASRHRVAELERGRSELWERLDIVRGDELDVTGGLFGFRFVDGCSNGCVELYVEDDGYWHHKMTFDRVWLKDMQHCVDRARSTLEGKHPNAESLAAMQELEDGGGEMFSSVEALMKDLESDD